MVGQVRESDQVDRKQVVKPVLVVIALGSDQEVDEGSAEVLAELDQVEDLHLVGVLGVLGEVVVEVGGAACAAQPGGEVACVLDHQICGQGCESVVE